MQQPQQHVLQQQAPPQHTAFGTAPGVAGSAPARASRWGAGAPPAEAAPGTAEVDFATLQAFAIKWSLDESAQTALLQLDTATQAKVVTDFAPKPGTRDVNRLFHGFLRSMQSGHPPPHRPGAGAEDPFAVLYADGAGGVNTAEQQNAALLTQLYQTELGVDPARIQAFCSTWGLDEGAHAALMQLDPQVQAQVMQDFAPKAHTQDVNRLFHGFIKSVGFRAVGGVAAPSLAGAGAFGGSHAGARLAAAGRPGGHAGSQAANIGAAITESLAAQGGYVPPSARRTAVAAGVAGMAHHGAQPSAAAAAAAAKRLGSPVWGGEEAPPGPDEVASFLQAWGLDSACGAALEGQSGEVQRRVLEQFRPREGTRDVRSLFYGFIKSVAAGGGKRPRGELHAGYVPDDLISA